MAPRFSIEWAMPSAWTFEIKPIYEFIRRHVRLSDVIVDPFSGRSTLGTYRNDLAHGGVDAVEFCRKLAGEGIAADVVVFDPPYSPRQIAECYKSIGRHASMKDTQSAVLYSEARSALGGLLRPGGVALSFGWQSHGFGVTYETVEVLLVQHGGAHNDTICVAQRKPLTMFEGGE